jgi:hypothetical protein
MNSLFREFFGGIVATAAMFVGAMLVWILVMILLAMPFSWLWNAALVPAVHGLEPIDYWQALGLFLLAGIGRMALAGAQHPSNSKD